MNLIIISLLVLGITGLAAAVLLYFIAQKFKVEEDPRIDEVQAVLPGANCGGCGFAGCRALAEACTKAGSLDGLMCPVGGAPTMEKVGAILGMTAPESEPKVAVIRCNGTCEARPKTSEYNGTRSCAIMSAMYVGESGCAYGCLGCGDCVAAYCEYQLKHGLIGERLFKRNEKLTEVDEKVGHNGDERCADAEFLAEDQRAEYYKQDIHSRHENGFRYLGEIVREFNG